MSPERRRYLGDLVRLTAFLVVAGLLTAWLVVVTGDLRGGERRSYAAEFEDVSGLQVGDQVRVASVVAGRVSDLEVLPDSTVRVSFDLDAGVELDTSTTATVRYRNLIGDRFVELARTDPAAPAVEPGATIPTVRTASALDIDTLLAGFRPLFVGLNPQQVNELSSQLVAVLQGQRSAIGSLLASTGSLTTTLGEQQELVTSVLTNLDAALATFDDRAETLDALVVALSRLVDGLAADDTALLDAADQIEGLTGDAAGLLAAARGDLAADVSALGTLAAGINSERDTLGVVLGRLPDHYTTVQGAASYGNFFNFFLCGVRLQLLDVGGQPVQTPWIDSEAERCR